MRIRIAGVVQEDGAGFYPTSKQSDGAGLSVRRREPSLRSNLKFDPALVPEEAVCGRRMASNIGQPIE